MPRKAQKNIITHTREHMRNRARNLNAQQACNAKQEAEHAGNSASPDKHRSLPMARFICGKPHNCPEFAIEQDERDQEKGGSQVGPIRELNCAAATMREGRLDEHRVERDEQRRKKPIEERK